MIAKINGFLNAMTEAMILLIVALLPEYQAETVVTTVNCAACQYITGQHDTWEWDVRCNVAPTGVLSYGKYCASIWCSHSQ